MANILNADIAEVSCRNCHWKKTIYLNVFGKSPSVPNYCSHCGSLLDKNYIEQGEFCWKADKEKEFYPPPDTSFVTKIKPTIGF